MHIPPLMVPVLIWPDVVCTGLVHLIAYAIIHILYDVSIFSIVVILVFILPLFRWAGIYSHFNHSQAY